MKNNTSKFLLIMKFDFAAEDNTKGFFLVVVRENGSVKILLFKQHNYIYLYYWMKMLLHVQAAANYNRLKYILIIGWN